MTDKGLIVTLTFEAVYEGGVLKPVTPLPLKEHERVRVAIDNDVDQRTSCVEMTAGLLGWTGDAATIERIALDPEFGIHEAP